MAVIRIYKNDTVTLEFTAKGGGSVLDLTGTTIYFLIVDTSRQQVANKTATITDPSNGKFQVELTPTETGTEGDFFYEIIWEYATGKKRTLGRDKLRILPSDKS